MLTPFALRCSRVPYGPPYIPLQCGHDNCGKDYSSLKCFVEKKTEFMFWQNVFKLYKYMVWVSINIILKAMYIFNLSLNSNFKKISGVFLFAAIKFSLVTFLSSILSQMNFCLFLAPTTKLMATNLFLFVHLNYETAYFTACESHPL